MSAEQSNLSTTGFDFVVAVTQDSMNGTLDEYLYQGLPEVILCYIYDANNNPVATDYKTFVSDAADPFTVPNGTPSSDSRVQTLNNAGFAFAVKAKLGLPPGVSPSQLSPTVVLKPGQSNVTYTMMFAEFVATELVFGPRGSVTWFNQSQPSGTSWTFTGQVDLDFQDQSFTSLPQNIQNQLTGIGSQNMFSVQQLYYDLNSSDLEQSFQFNNVPSNSALNTFMTSDFINSYWKALGGTNSEVLGYGATKQSGVDPSSLAVTSLNFFTPSAVGSSGAPLTLNYLCATNNNTLPATTNAGFGWNWVEANEVSQWNGVAALNRNTFANYLYQQLSGYIASNCYSPSVTVTYVGGIKLKVDYSWSLTPGQTATRNSTPTGSVILSVSYSSSTASDQAGLDGDAGKMELSSTFNLTVEVIGNQMIITQNLVVYCYVRYLATPASGNVVDKQIVDTYTFGVDGEGNVVVTPPSPNATPQTSVTTYNGQSTPGANGFLNFWANVDNLATDVAQWAQSCVGTNLTDIPVSIVQNFVFPGGATFSFFDASFSANQDFVAHITYADPS